MTDIPASTTPPASPTQLHLRPRQAAARHGVSLSWLWGAIANGKISAPRKIGARISLFEISCLDREIAALMSAQRSRAA
jgi:predicted DNA-binding transcriptional regulator AlpA